MEQNINVNITDGVDFFSHETSVQFTPIQFVLDFKSITPRIDQRSEQGNVYSVRHNVVLVDPFHAKQLAQLLGSVVANYEKEFGVIQKPKQFKKIETKRPKAAKTVAPAYLG